MNAPLKANHSSSDAYPIKLSELSTAAGGAGAPLVEGINPLHQVKTALQACVGSVSLSIGELMALQANQVVRLNQALEEPIDLLVEGKPVARGQLVAVDGQFAIRITELPVALHV